jgi:glycosyltransferase involved in cell wall biosynthesis
MRIAMVSPFDPFGPRDGHAHVGGVERVLAELSTRLQARGHQLDVICSAEASGRGDSVRDDGVRVRRLRRIGTFMRAPLADWSDCLQGNYDLVHVPATYPFVTPGLLKRAQRLHLPAVLDFHFEPDPVTALGRAAARAYRIIGPPSYRSASRVLVRSHDYARHAPSLAGIPEERRRELPNGIDPARFHPDAIPAGDGYLLFVGRLVPYKGLDVALRALSAMQDAPPLWVVGDGPMRESWQDLAKHLHVRTRWFTHVPDDALPGFYTGAVLTILPSVGRQECFGISLLESMASGTPVVASDLPGVRAVAQMGGVTATPGDVASWQQTLQAALAGDLPRGRALARTIRMRCSWEAVTLRLEQCYEEVACESSP